MEGLVQVDGEAQISSRRRGGWITYFFITGCIAGITVAAFGWSMNLIVYLIEEFHVNSIDAAQITNVVNGCTSLFPVMGAAVADTVGSFPVITVSAIVSLLGILLLDLTAVFKFLLPQPCDNGSSLCSAPSRIQYTVLYSGIALASIGIGGTRFTLATMGANQLDNTKEQETFFNWYFFTFYVASLVGSTAIVYIEDNVSWAWGFGLCFAANTIGLAIFVSGKRLYRIVQSQGSPFVGLARVIVAAIRKRKAMLPNETEGYYYGHDHGGVLKSKPTPPTKSFRFLNRAAVKGGDIASDGSLQKRWTLCTVQEVEDFKAIVKIFPLWSSSIFLGTPIAILYSLVVLQALTMDRHIGSHFKIPAGSIPVVVMLSCSIFISLNDRLLFPAWQKLTGRYLTHFQRIGVGHVLNILSMAISALIESRRLRAIQEHHLQSQPGAIVPMLGLWLFPQLALVGIGEAFHLPGQIALYYEEFPTSLKNTATAMISVIIGISYYMSTFLIDLFRRLTEWLPNNINKGRLDNMYWVLFGTGVLNFGYYLVCAMMYKHQEVDTITSNDS